MFFHNFKYALITLFKNKMLIFWTFAFPIILGALFNMAFSNINSSEKLDIINIAIVDDNAFQSNEIFKNTFHVLSDENNEEQLFNTTYATLEEAQDLLDKKKIVGYLKLVDNNPELIFNTNGIDQTIFKYVTEEIGQTSDIITNLTQTEIEKELAAGNYNINYEELYQNVLEMSSFDDVKLKDVSNENLDYVMIEFYTLIAMTCLYGGMLSIVSINQTLANMSNKGKRVSVAPTPKWVILFSNLLASYLAQLIGLALLFIFTIFVLHVDYGNNIPLIIILSMVGSLAGLSLGIFVGTLFKTNENAKTGILLAFTMFGCFLSGMMGITMKFIVDKNIPIVNKLNPASMITDGFYSLYYYTTLDRFWFNIISLFIFTILLITISFFSLRRQKYDSI